MSKEKKRKQINEPESTYDKFVRIKSILTVLSYVAFFVGTFIEQEQILASVMPPEHAATLIRGLLGTLNTFFSVVLAAYSATFYYTSEAPDLFLSNSEQKNMKQTVWLLFIFDMLLASFLVAIGDVELVNKFTD